MSDIPFSQEDLQDAINHIINEKIRPYILNHGGDIDFISLNNTDVHVRLNGKCGSCASSVSTIKNLVEKELRSFIHPSLTVIHIKE